MLEQLTILPSNPALKGQAELKQHIRYSESGQELTLILPWAAAQECPDRYPVLLFVQGSAWTTPNLDYEIPMLSRYAEEGIAVATVCHRSVQDGFPFPTFLRDVKCAIRFLRRNAETYHLDADRMAAFGTSSGGHTVLMLGLTADEEEYRTEEYSEQSDRVQSVCAIFPPTNLNKLFAGYEGNDGATGLMTAAFGPDKAAWGDIMRHYSPVNLVSPRSLPPFMLVHGTADPVVPVAQMEEMCTVLRENGQDVTAYYVDGAEHEGNFWSPEVRSVIHEYIVRQLLKA